MYDFAETDGTRDHCPGPAHTATSVELEIPPGSRYRAIGRLVAGGFAARLGLTVDRISDLQLALELVLAQASRDGSIGLVMSDSAHELRIEIGPLAGDARSLREVESVVSSLVDEASVGDFGQHAWLALRVACSSPRVSS